jgi:hypothetical protein
MNEETKEETPGTAEAPVSPATPVTIEAPEVELTIEEAKAWQGFRLDDVAGASVGKIEAIYVDEQGGRPEWLLARMGRFGHHCLIPARDAVAAGEHVWVPYSRGDIRKAPRIEAGKPLDRAAELALLEHYGVGSQEAGRGADIAERDADAVTARPA